MTSVALKQHLTSPLAMRLIPYLALFAGMVTLAGGTSFAKTLFPVIGAEGTSAYRVGISAVLLVAAASWGARAQRNDGAYLYWWQGSLEGKLIKSTLSNGGGDGGRQTRSRALLAHLGRRRSTRCVLSNIVLQQWLVIENVVERGESG